MDIEKEKEAFEEWYENHKPTLLVENIVKGTARAAWQAAKAQANKQFENFIDQAIEDSACADERRSLQYLLDEFRDIVMVEVAQDKNNE